VRELRRELRFASLRDLATALAERNHFNAAGNPFHAAAIKNMLRR
jgi:hypothetical protein